jgi:hypothetical protein
MEFLKTVGKGTLLRRSKLLEQLSTSSFPKDEKEEKKRKESFSIEDSTWTPIFEEFSRMSTVPLSTLVAEGVEELKSKIEEDQHAMDFHAMPKPPAPAVVAYLVRIWLMALPVPLFLSFADDETGNSGNTPANAPPSNPKESGKPGAVAPGSSPNSKISLGRSKVQSHHGLGLMGSTQWKRQNATSSSLYQWTQFGGKRHLALKFR